ncbi:hypothetical protein HELRODRAFT_159693 [Helobdella robusta]|uniref:BHLH domain-containing protein n=1 Tax=Helobdella robusta TaxID=6412 RepID=T1EPB4_HELRO|nr:hypothetical protein HELRODRAFT_159693 [Helobdella robusta]ESO13089.1 hypothetical protein HELRODRAFT_159693 [Helobdella robusta]
MNNDKEKYFAKESLLKARKRHFDSRWRANIASCFETLLNIIPLSKRANKKQSKANILKAAEEHLGFLEAHLSTLLLKKAKKENVDDVDNYCALSMNKIKEDFIEEQHAKPRRYNIKEETQLAKSCRRSLDREFEISKTNEHGGCIVNDIMYYDPQMLLNISRSYVASDINVEDEVEVNIEKYDETDNIEVDGHNSQMSSSSLAPSPAARLSITSDPWMAPSCFASLIAQNTLNATHYNNYCEEGRGNDQAAKSGTDTILSNLYDSSDDYIGRHSPLFGALMQF